MWHQNKLIMIEKLIKERMQVVGLTQAKVAEVAQCTPSQMGLFLKSEASLNRDALDKCLQVVGIDLNINLNRIEYAKKTALKLKDIENDRIKNMSREDMVRITGLPGIEFLPNPSEKEFEGMIISGICDYEATFPFFKAMVLHFHNLGIDNPTPKRVQNSLETIVRGIPKAAAVAALAGAMPISIIGLAIGALMSSRIYSKAANNAWAPLLSITKNLLKK